MLLCCRAAGSRGILAVISPARGRYSPWATFRIYHSARSTCRPCPSCETSLATSRLSSLLFGVIHGMCQSYLPSLTPLSPLSPTHVFQLNIVKLLMWSYPVPLFVSFFARTKASGSSLQHLTLGALVALGADGAMTQPCHGQQRRCIALQGPRACRRPCRVGHAVEEGRGREHGEAEAS